MSEEKITVVYEDENDNFVEKKKVFENLKDAKHFAIRTDGIIIKNNKSFVMSMSGELIPIERFNYEC